MPKIQPAQDESLLGTVFSNLIRARNFVICQTATVVDTTCQYVTSPEYRRRTHDNVRRFHNERPLLTIFLAIQVALASIPLLLFLGYVLSTALVGFGCALVFLLFWTSIGLFFFGCALLVTGSIGAFMFISFIVFQRAVQLLNALTSTLSQGARPSQKQEERQEPLPKAEKILRIVDVKQEDWQNGTQEDKVNGDKELVSSSTSNKLSDIVKAAKVEANPHVWWTIPLLMHNKTRRFSPWAAVAISCAEDLIRFPYRSQGVTPFSFLFPILFSVLPETPDEILEQLDSFRDLAIKYGEDFHHALNIYDGHGASTEPFTSLEHANIYAERRKLMVLVSDLEHLIYGDEMPKNQDAHQHAAIPETDNEAVSETITSTPRDREILTTDQVLQLLDHGKTGPLKHEGWIGWRRKPHNLQTDGHQFVWIDLKNLAVSRVESPSNLERAKTRKKAIRRRLNAYLFSQPTTPRRSTNETSPFETVDLNDLREEPARPSTEASTSQSQDEGNQKDDSTSEITEKPIPKPYLTMGDALAAVQAELRAEEEERESDYEKLCETADRVRDTAAIFRLKTEDPNGPYSSIPLDDVMVRVVTIQAFDQVLATTFQEGALKGWLDRVKKLTKAVQRRKEWLEEMKTMEAYKDRIEDCENLLDLMEHHVEFDKAFARRAAAAGKAKSNAEEGPEGKGKGKVKGPAPAPAQDHNDIAAAAWRKHGLYLLMWTENAKEKYLASKAAASAGGLGTGADEVPAEGSSSKSAPALAGPSQSPDRGDERAAVQDSSTLISAAGKTPKVGEWILIERLRVIAQARGIEENEGDQSASFARLRALANENGIGMTFLKGFETLSKDARRTVLSAHARAFASFQLCLSDFESGLKAPTTAVWRDGELTLVRMIADGEGSSSSALVEPGPSQSPPDCGEERAGGEDTSTLISGTEDSIDEMRTIAQEMGIEKTFEKGLEGAEEEWHLIDRLRLRAQEMGIGEAFEGGLQKYFKGDPDLVGLIAMEVAAAQMEPGFAPPELMAAVRERELAAARLIAAA
ncbi:hypothetical protein QBC32DRAFT_246978, partial [Pseudoneurospora amorphoporcata]